MDFPFLLLKIFDCMDIWNHLDIRTHPSCPFLPLSVDWVINIGNKAPGGLTMFLSPVSEYK